MSPTRLTAEPFEDRTVPAGVTAGDVLAVQAGGTGGPALVDLSPVTGAATVITQGGDLVRPTGVAYDPATGVIYVSDADAFGGPGGVIAVDPRTGTQTPVARLTGLADPSGIAVSGGTAYVSDPANDRVVAVDLASGGVGTVAAGGPLSTPGPLAVTPAGVFVLDGTNLLRVDPGTGAVTTVATGLGGPVGITPGAGGTLNVSVTGGLGAGGLQGGVVSVDPATGTVTALSVGDVLTAPGAVATTPGGSVIGVQNTPLGDALVSVDPATGSQRLLSFVGGLLGDVTGLAAVGGGGGGTGTGGGPGGAPGAAGGESSRTRTLAVGGAADGSARVYTQDLATGQFTPTGSVSPFGPLATAVRTAAGDVDGDGTGDTVYVTGPGVPVRVAVVSGADNRTLLVQPFDPFGGDFAGGGFVAAGDLDRDGRAEFVVTPDQGGGPRVSIFSLGTDRSVTTRANFFGIGDPAFRGGARAAVGDVNADGTPDVVVAAGFGGGPRVAVFDGRTALGGTPAKLVNDFFAFDDVLRNGVYVAVGDLDDDGFGDLVFGAGPGGGPRVLAVSGAKLLSGGAGAALAAPVANFFAGGADGGRGGVRVATKADVPSGRVSLATGPGAGGPGQVRVYPGAAFPAAGEPGVGQVFDPFGGAALTDGIYVG